MPGIQLLSRSDRRPSFSQQLAQGLGSGITQGIGQSLTQMYEKKKNIGQLEGLSPMFEQLGVPKEGIEKLVQSGVDPQVAIAMAGHIGTLKKQQQKMDLEKEQRVSPLKRGLKLVERQEELLSRGNLGPKAGRPGQAPKLLSAMSKEGQKDRSEYEQIGKALISLGSNIPIRNQQEFNVLAERFYDPTLTESEIKGTIDGIRRVISEGLNEEGISLDSLSSKGEQGSSKKTLTVDMAEKFLKAANGDKEKARKEARKHGYEF